MPATALSTSTLSEAITSETNDFTVASTASITVGQLLVIRNEAVKVQEIPVSGRVKVMRGVAGTAARAHASGQRFFIGDPDDFKSIKDSLTALVGDSGVYPDFLLPGQRAQDGQGNEYVLVDLTATLYGGSTIAISNDGLYTGAALKGGSHQGPVGLLVEQGTSDQYVWAQIRGYNAYAQSKTTPDATSASICTATTTVSTPNVGLTPWTLTTDPEYFIHGMFIVGASTSAVTSATSATGQAVPVYLNYPYVLSRLETAKTSPTS